MKTILACTLVWLAMASTAFAQLQPPRDSAFVLWNGFDHVSGKPVRFTRLGDRIRDLNFQNGLQTGRHIHSFASRERSPRAQFTSYGTAVWAPGVSAIPVVLAFDFSGRPNRDHSSNYSLRQTIPAEWLQYEQATVVINGFQLQRQRGPAPAYSLLDIRLSSASLDETDTVLEFEASATVNCAGPGFLRRKGRTTLIVECLLIASDPSQMNQRMATIRQPDAWSKKDSSSSTIGPRNLGIDAQWDTTARAGAIGISAFRVVTSKPFKCERLAMAFEQANYTARGGHFDLKTHLQYRTVPPGAPRRQRQRGASEIRMDVVLMQFKNGVTKPVKFTGSVNGEPRGMPADESEAEYSNQFTVGR